MQTHDIVDTPAARKIFLKTRIYIYTYTTKHKLMLQFTLQMAKFFIQNIFDFNKIIFNRSRFYEFPSIR